MSGTEVIYKDHIGCVVEADLEDEWYGNRYYVDAGDDRREALNVAVVDFQRGNPATEGVNGLTNEQLLAIIIHRTKILDAKFSSPYNREAITSMEQALANFERRTKERQQRGVEGTPQA